MIMQQARQGGPYGQRGCRRRVQTRQARVFTDISPFDSRVKVHVHQQGQVGQWHGGAL